MVGTTSSIISNVLSFLERLSPFILTTSLAASSSSSSSSSIAGEDVNTIQKRFMEDLTRLSRMLPRIQAVLYDAEERQIYDKAIQLWLRELTNVAYEAEDVLDQYDYQVIKTQVEGMTTTEETMPSLKGKLVDDDDIYGYQVSLTSSTSIKIPISCEMAEHIMKVIQNFDEIAKDKENLKLAEEDAPRRPYFNDPIKRPQSISLVHESDVYGREEEKKKIIQLLISQSERENIVIPIVGMGGVGKTTLAQLVYNDPLVCQHFFPKVWICASEEFDVLRVTKEIVRSIMGSSIHNDNNNLNDLQCILKEALLDKKFLLIIDDVWNERPDMWEALLASFFCIGKGKIIVTTRLLSVARIMQAMPLLKLECLHEESSWLLFQRHAFCCWEPDQQQNFEQIGRGITKKCGGLPLALKSIGSFLRYEDNEEIWEDVLKNSLWELEDAKKNILPALMISYNHLPVHLKPCFLYASLFPKEHNFHKVELIRMWIAQGYIQLTRRNKLLENIASEFFEDLVRRSFFQPNGNDFTLHDMVHELAHFITKHEIFSSLDLVELKKIPKDVKHIFIRDINIDWVLLLGARRTLYIDRSYHFSAQMLHQNIFPMEPFSHLVCLRALTFHVPCFKCFFGFVDLISNLHQLRYLSIHTLTIQMTENSLCSLYKLQTLILQSPHINMLPQAIGKLINLRHLLIRCDTPKILPRSSLGLENLLTLVSEPYYSYIDIKNSLFNSYYSIKKRDGLYSSIGWLQHLTNLHGSLKICELENVVNREDAMISTLQNKPHIKSLALYWKKSEDDECARQDEAVLEGLQPHANLEELTLDGYGGNRFPSWFSNPHFSNLMGIPSSYLNNNGDFVHLKHLHIFFCEELRHISTLPSSLREFVVQYCKRLEYISLSCSSEPLAWLQKVEICFCHSLKLIINLNYCVSTLKVLRLVDCALLKPNPVEDYHSFGRVSFEKDNAHVYNCHWMRMWCKRHGITYNEKHQYRTAYFKMGFHKKWTLHQGIVEARFLLLRIQALLEDAEKMEIHSEDIQLWLSKLREVIDKVDILCLRKQNDSMGWHISRWVLIRNGHYIKELPRQDLCCEEFRHYLIMPRKWRSVTRTFRMSHQAQNKICSTGFRRRRSYSLHVLASLKHPLTCNRQSMEVKKFIRASAYCMVLSSAFIGNNLIHLN